MKILFPPTPKSKINPNTLETYEKGRHKGRWIAQRKFNGTHIVLCIKPALKSVYVLTRHGEEPKQWSLSSEVAEQLLALHLDQDKEYWLDGELYHNKTSTPYYKNRIVLYDILYAGQTLFLGLNLMERIALLSEICGKPQDLEETNIAFKVFDNVWMAQTFESGFRQRFEEFLHLDEIEGLVLKNRTSQLNDTCTREWEVDWMIRCRKPHKNYGW